MQTLGLIYCNRFDPDYDDFRGNLLVGPLAILPQWKEEISKKGDPSDPLRTVIYTGPCKKKGESLLLDTVPRLKTSAPVAPCLSSYDVGKHHSVR